MGSFSTLQRRYPRKTMSHRGRTMLATSALVLATAACGGTSTQSSTGDAGAGGDASTGVDASGDVNVAPTPIGAPCIPSLELSPTFAAFDENTVTVDEGNAACGGGVCLVNHFRGRASCPYGQSSTGTAIAPASPCTVPGTSTPVRPNDPSSRQTVPSQCADRTASADVTCSCRCANGEGKTDDGAHYCACPSGFSCAQIVPVLVAGDTRAGGYCVRDGTAYDRSSACSVSCDATQGNCPAADAGATPTGGDVSTTYIVTVMSTTPGLCLGQSLATDGSGLAKCQVFVVLAATDTCAAHAGLASADTLVASSLRTLESIDPSQPICVLTQLAAPCASSAQGGWCYVVAPAAPNGCATAIELSSSGMPPSGASALLACP
jgi:hypothetical protein